jgi:hypothetical protein
MRLSATHDSLASREVRLVARSAGDIVTSTLTLLNVADAHLEPYRRRSLQVVDDASSRPLESAEVLDAFFGRVVGRTSASGRLSLATVAQGTTLLQIRKPGYEARSILVTIRPNDTLPVAIRLRTVAQLAAVKVTATSIQSRRAIASGFETRAKLHFGHFMTPAEMDKHWGQPLHMALAWIGVRQRDRGSAVILLGGHRVPGCPVSIYIDGIPFFTGERGVSPPDASRMNAADYAAAEYYPDSDGAPAQFSMTGAGCGVLLLWTRD